MARARASDRNRAAWAQHTSFERQGQTHTGTAFLCTIKEIEEWCSYRNEIVHALMNKNLESMESELKEKAEAGMRLASRIDLQERMIKKGNKIRKGINLVIEM